MSVKKRIKFSATLSIAAMSVVIGSLPKTVSAAVMTDTWAGGNNVSWSQGPWNPGNNPPTTGDSLLFTGTTAGANSTDNLGNVSINNLTFNNGAKSYTIGNSSSAIQTITGNVIDNATNAQTIGSGVTTLALGGAGGVQVNAGTLILDGNNTYTGATTIASGATLQIGNDDNTSAQLGDATTASASAVTDNGTLLIDLKNANPTWKDTFTGTGAISLEIATGTGSTLKLDGNNTGFQGTINVGTASVGTTAGINDRLELDSSTNLPGSSSTIVVANGSGIFANTAFSYSGTLDLNGLGDTATDGAHPYGALHFGSASTETGTVDLQSNALIGLQSNATMSGLVTGSGRLEIASTGTLTLSDAADNWAGGTAIFNGTLKTTVAMSNNPLGNVIFGSNSGYGGATTPSSGKLDLDGTSQTVSGLSVAAGTNNLIGNSSTTANATLTFAGGTNPSTFSGTIEDTLGSGTKTTTLDIVSGTLTLSGINSYSGGTIIGNGALIVGNSSAIPTNTNVTFGDGTGDSGTLDLGGIGATVGGLAVAPGSTGTQTITNNGGATSTAATLTFAGGNSTFSGIIQNGSQATALTVASGSLALAAANTYSGATTIDNNATLQVGAGASTGTLGSASVTDNGTLAFDRGDAALNVTNNINGTGLVEQTGTGTTTISGLVGSGAVAVQVNAGMLVLANADSYTGTTTISGGTLQVSGANTETLSGKVTGVGNLNVGDGSTATNLTLSNSSNNMTGPLAINTPGGQLAATGSFGATTLTSGTLEATGVTPGAGMLTLASLNSTGGTILFNVGNNSNADLITVTGMATLGGSTTISLNGVGTPTLGENIAILTAGTLANSIAAAGNGTLASGSAGGESIYVYQGGATLSGALASDAAYAADASTDQLFLYVTASGSGGQTIPATLHWNNASGNGLWDINTSANWNDTTDNVNPAVYQENSVHNDDVHFDDSNGGNYNVTLNTTVQPDSIIVDNSAGNYVISGTGSISGTTVMDKNGTDSLTLDTVNTYTGATTINAGTLALGSTGSIVDSSVIYVATNATFDVSQVANYTLGGSTSQQLEGSGNVTGNITIGVNGTLSPGIPSSNTIGTLTVNGSVTLTTGSNISAQVTATSGVNDELIATGNVVLGNANGNISSVGALTNGESFTVIQGNVYGWFNNNGGSLPTLSAGLSWNSPLQINNNLPGAANTYQQNIVLSVTNGTPVYASNLPAADTYAGFNISEHGGGRGTQVTFLGGTVSAATSLSVQFTAAPADATHLISDYAAVNGTTTDTYVLELSYTSTQLGSFEPTSPVLAVDSGGTLESAVLLNSGGTAHEILGAYTSADFALGDYGVDTTNDVVWAVLNYSAGDKFGISSRLVGDAAGTGVVTPQDISIVLANQGDTTELWSLGDFNDTNTVTPQDISQVLAAQGQTATGSSISVGGLITSSPVPEPGSLALLAVGALGMVLHGRSSRKKLM